MLQALTEANPDATVLSIDGVSAFDVVSRRAMLAALRRVHGSEANRTSGKMMWALCTTFCKEKGESRVTR